MQVKIKILIYLQVESSINFYVLAYFISYVLKQLLLYSPPPSDSIPSHDIFLLNIYCNSLISIILSQYTSQLA